MIYGIRLNTRDVGKAAQVQEFNDSELPKGESACGLARMAFARARDAAMPGESGALYCRQPFGAGMTLERFAA